MYICLGLLIHSSCLLESFPNSRNPPMGQGGIFAEALEPVINGIGVKNIFSESQQNLFEDQKNCCEHQEKLKPKEQTEGRKEGRED